MARDLLVDMDGVFVDFVRGAFDFHKKSIPYDQVKWDFDKVLFPEDVTKFWSPLGFEFWANLPWTPQGKDLIYELRWNFGTDNICFCTSPCDTVGSIEGKIEWLRRNIPDMARQFMVTPVKKFAASKDRVLLDDSDSNCDKFVQAGGSAVLVPQPWNRLKGEPYDVSRIIEELQLKLRG